MVERAVKRQEAFKRLEEYLRIIKETVEGMDQHAEVFLFGSVAENRHTDSSDIDVLIVTKVDPAKVHFKLWNSGIKEPFEIHVQPPEKAEPYKRRAKLIKV